MAVYSRVVTEGPQRKQIGVRGSSPKGVSEGWRGTRSPAGGVVDGSAGGGGTKLEERTIDLPA